MNVLFTKNSRKIVDCWRPHASVQSSEPAMTIRETLEIPIETPVSANPSGDGDGAPPRCCRLCGADNGLHFFGDTFLCEGGEVRYDRLMYDCFGVTVTPKHCMICDRCVRSLRSTERFRALVYAAFDRPRSEASSSSSLIINTNLAAENIEIIPVTVNSTKGKLLEGSRKKMGKKKSNAVDVKCRRTNVPCEICKQRYPMMVTPNDQKPFVCSRCKKFGETRSTMCRRCNVMIPANLLKDHQEIHNKANLRAKIRLGQPKKLQALTNNGATEKQLKYHCGRCPKKFAIAKNLLIHLKDMHGDEIDDDECYLSANHYNEKNESQEPSNMHQCDKCPLVFKNRKSLTYHSQEHCFLNQNSLQ